MDKKILIISLLAVSLFLAACEIKAPVEDKTPPAEIECQTDDECIAGGCSGTVCQSKDAEPVFTTCEWREEYACYKQTSCSCINGKCQWEETEEFQDCLGSKNPLSSVIT